MKIIKCLQGSSEWAQLRCGIPTASDFGNLVTPEGKIRTGQMPESYLMEKVAERIMGAPADSFTSQAMANGSVMESEALGFLEVAHGLVSERVGFCTTDDGKIGASPDALAGKDNGVELKCPEPHTAIKYLLDGGVPKQYIAQVQGCMFVTGRPRWTFISYARFVPPLIVHVERDEAYQAALQTALTRFVADLEAATERIRAMMKSQGGRE